MNILFRGPYPQRDGWGQASRDFLRALTKTEHQIKAIPIIMANLVGGELPDDIKQLEQTEFTHLDVYIQHALPSLMERQQGVLNIGLCATETNHLENTGWVKNINEMDALFVWTDQEKLNMMESGVTIPVHVVPQPIDTQFFDSVTDRFDEDLVNDNFVFYFVGEWNERKNLNDLILAYWREFTPDEKVKLLIKASAGFTSPDVLGKSLTTHLDRLKSVFRLYNKSTYYPEVIVIAEYLSNEDLVKLHNSCDCFVTTSYGEATCIPLLNAAYLGKTVICTCDIGADDPDLDIVRVNSIEVPCVCASPPLPYLYSSWETWRKVDVIDLQHKMREVYDGKKCNNDRTSIRSKYSLESVATRIEDLLRRLHLSKVRR